MFSLSIPSCYEKTSNFTNLSYNILLHVTILFIFLSVFFVYFITPIIKNSINGEIIDNIDKLIIPQIKKYNKINMDDYNIDSLKSLFKNDNDYADMNNSWLFTLIVIINSVLILFLILIAFILRFNCNLCLPMTHLLIVNAVIFMFIGLIEYLFFIFVALQYVPVKPSVLTKSFIDDVKVLLK